METKHTKGQWEFEQTDSVPSGLDLLITCNDFKLGWLYSNTIEAEANAKLIAAAPELLEALMRIKILYMDSPIDEYFEPYKEAWEEVDNAIKKATE